MAGELWLLLRRGRRLVLGTLLFSFTSMLILIFLVKERKGFDVSLAEFILDQTGILPLAPHRYCRNCSQFAVDNLPAETDWCKTDNPFLLVLVISHQKNKLKRDAIRQSWANALDDTLPVKVLFVIASDPKVDRAVAISNEQSTHKDLLQLGLTEEYRSLTNKSMAALHWVVKECPRAKYILKTDDDCYNNLKLFHGFLSTHQRKSPTEEFIGGFCFTTRPIRYQKSRWYTSKKDYPDVYYPMYCGGPAYVLSQSAVRKVVEVSTNIRFFHLEDVFVTGFCREAASIRYLQIPGVLTSLQRLSNCDLRYSVLNIHQVGTREMVALWNKTVTLDEICLPLIMSNVNLLGIFVLIISLLLVWFVRRQMASQILQCPNWSRKLPTMY